MNNDVTVSQKFFEKFLMLCRNDEELDIVVTKCGSVVVCYGESTPLAKLLTKDEILAMVPHVSSSVRLKTLFEIAKPKTKGKKPKDFGTGKQNTYFTNKMLDEVGL
tara:strand:- start:176 stop:493 length:318 start_codon:yes stop_codon:yes gene_type:complete